MMIRLLLAVACAFLCIGEAHADDVLHFGVQPAWVVDQAPAPAKTFEGAVTNRLLEIQLRFDASGSHQFMRQVARVNTPEGLQGIGTVVVAWQPGLGSITVNRVLIRRGTETIDVMKDGKGFQILRREAGLESATISGILTAMLQIPDLRVGDEVELAYTLDMNNPVLDGHVEAMFPFNDIRDADRVAIRVSWPTGRPVLWKGGPQAPTPAITKSGGFEWATFLKDGWKKPDTPAGAPPRFALSALVQFGDFADWAAVAGVMRPLYEKAATIAPDSPIMTEVKRIAALSTDPAVRASEALRVVQSQVRYLARLDGLGGYKPESADTVWSGKSGDCKGKTVLLLAMLRALGITADPAVVSATAGDGLDQSLPLPGRFNHVIVRAVIGGKTYWLDGTRLGDRGIASIAVPAFKWALPLDAATKAPVALVVADPSAPQSDAIFELDAREGLGKPAKATGSVVYHGEAANSMRTMLSVLGGTDRDTMLRKVWTGRYSFVTVNSVASKVDEQTGDVTLSFVGTADMDWSGGDYGVKRYEADDARMGRYLTSKRDTDVDAAPVAVDADYSTYRETILLPDSGKGFVLEGEPVDRTIAGVHYVRTVSLKDGKFEMTTLSRNTAAEISYADGKAADKQVDELWKKQVYVRAPGVAVATGTAAAKTGAAADPNTPDAELKEAFRLSAAGQDDDALKLLDARFARGQKDALGLASRGWILRKMKRSAEASAALDQALAMNSRLPFAIVTKAEMLADDGRYDDALILYDRLVLLLPDEVSAYIKRADARMAAGQYDGALADYAVAIQKLPGDEYARTRRVAILTLTDKRAEALAEARDFVKLKPDNGTAHALLANVLAEMGQKAEAASESSKAIAIEPTAENYDMRLRYGLSGSAKDQLADVLAMIKLEPTRDVPLVALRRLVADPASRATILKAYDDAIAANPKDADIPSQRAVAVALTGDAKSLIAALDKDRAKGPDDWSKLNSACWTRATLKIDLDTALARCDRSVDKRRLSANLDSRGLVHFQRGEWAAAVKDMDDALAMRPDQAGSLYVRGAARKKLGDLAGSKADLAAAARYDANVADTYAGYGVVP